MKVHIFGTIQTFVNEWYSISMAGPRHSSALGEIHIQRPLVLWWREFLQPDQSTVARPFCKIKFLNILFARQLPVCLSQGPFQHPFTSKLHFSLVHRLDRTFTEVNLFPSNTEFMRTHKNIIHTTNIQHRT